MHLDGPRAGPMLITWAGNHHRNITESSYLAKQSDMPNHPLYELTRFPRPMIHPRSTPQGSASSPLEISRPVEIPLQNFAPKENEISWSKYLISKDAENRNVKDNHQVLVVAVSDTCSAASLSRCQNKHSSANRRNTSPTKLRDDAVMPLP